MFPIPSTEKLSESKVCRQCQASFPITDKDLEFYDKVSPVFPLRHPVQPVHARAGSGSPDSYRIEGDKIKYLIPTPTLCPDCRQQRRLAWRNERCLFQRKCDYSGKTIISVYPPDTNHVVYEESVWWSDAWDPLAFGVSYDESRSFFDQFQSLLTSVPRRSLHQDGTNENSTYTTLGGYNKNCYLTSGSMQSEDVYFGGIVLRSKNCVDSFMCIDCQIMYECSDCNRCYNCMWCRDSDDCSDSYCLDNCKDCHYCIGCTNITGKKYHILNSEVSKEDYEKLRKSLESNTARNAFYRTYLALKHDLPNEASRTKKSENCSGNYIEFGKNCHHCFDLKLEGENMKYCQTVGWGAKDMMDCTSAGVTSDLLYEMHATTNSHLSGFTSFCRSGSNVYYCDCIGGCQDCFGCTGINNKQYCILNKQYTKEEYEALVPKIIEKMMIDGEWGEFFSQRLSPFGYNHSIASEYYPLGKDEALAKGFSWADYENPKPTATKTIPQEAMKNLPDTTEEVPDDILDWLLTCEISGKPFKLIKQELEFYRKHNLPIPKRHPDQRHTDRMALRNPRKLFERKCDKCKTHIISSYAPERHEIVYCEACYNSEVV